MFPGFGHLGETWLGNNFSTFEKHGWEILFSTKNVLVCSDSENCTRKQCFGSNVSLGIYGQEVMIPGLLTCGKHD